MNFRSEALLQNVEEAACKMSPSKLLSCLMRLLESLKHALFLLFLSYD